MSAVVEEIIETVHALPPDKQQQVREVFKDDKLIELLGVLLVTGLIGILSKTSALDASERQQLRERLNRELPSLMPSHLTPEQHARAALIHSVRGKYSHLPTSSDDFAARKAEEIVLEDRRSMS